MTMVVIPAEKARRVVGERAIISATMLNRFRGLKGITEFFFMSSIAFIYFFGFRKFDFFNFC